MKPLLPYILVLSLLSSHTAYSAIDSPEGSASTFGHHWSPLSLGSETTPTTDAADSAHVLGLVDWAELDDEQGSASVLAHSLPWMVVGPTWESGLDAGNSAAILGLYDYTEDTATSNSKQVIIISIF